MIEKKLILFNNDLGTELTLYYNTHEMGGTDLPPAPQNSNESKRTIKRSKTYYGVFTETSTDYIFTKKGATFLKNAFAFRNVEAKVEMKEYRFNPNKDEYYLWHTYDFDFYSYKPFTNYVKISFKTGGLNALLKSNWNEKFEVERTKALNGNYIGELSKTPIVLTSRKVFLFSRLQENQDQLYIYHRDDEAFRVHREPFPLEVVIPSDERLFSTFATQIESVESIGAFGEVREMFYFNNDRDKTLTLRFKGSFTISEESYFVGDVTNKDLYVKLKRFNQAEVLNPIEDILTPISITDNVMNYKGQEFEFDTEITIDLLEEESLAFVFEMSANYGSDPAFMQIKIDNPICQIEVLEDSESEDQASEILLVHDLLERQAQIITGEENRVVSYEFGNTDQGYPSDGDFSYLGFSLGFWIRQFYDKKLEFSIKQTIETLNAVRCVGYGIQVINGVEKIVVEGLEYFFQNQVVIDLGEVSIDKPDEVVKDYYYKSLEFGYKKPDGDNLYEETQGLDEYNGKRTWTSNLTRTEKKYSRLSEARADAYGKRFAMDKLKLNYPEEDTRYDKTVFLLDLKKGNGLALEERTWQDDYEQEPQNVYSPETATGLRLTPYRCNERHQWLYGAGLYNFQDEVISHGSSNLTSELRTKKEGQEFKGENDDISISDLARPRFKAMSRELNLNLTKDIIDQINGTTNINGREIPNLLFKIKYRHNRKTQYGYFLEMTENEGEIGIIKILISE